MRAVREWQLQDAKNRLSELVRRAADGPQEITVRGEPAAYLISPSDFRRLPDEEPNGGSWVDRLLALPGRGDFTNDEIDELFARVDGPEREVPDFSDDA
jgi:prevent-host-death family protein